MTLMLVHSSAIRAVGYAGGTLAVLFHTSDIVYAHPHVPLSVFHGLMAASSMGNYYNQFIRGKYR
jgi:KTSC domain